MINSKFFSNEIPFSFRYLLKRQKSTTTAAFVLLIAYILSMGLGLLRDRLLYAKFYSCCTLKLDVYNAAFRIPDLLFSLLVTGALSAAFIPVFWEYWIKNKLEAYRLASSVIASLWILFLVIGSLMFIFVYPVCKLIAPGFSPEQLLLMGKLTRIMLFAQAFFILSNFASGILQAQKRFLLPAIAPIAYNLSIISGIILFADKLGIFAPVLGVILGAFFHFLVQFPSLLFLGFKFVLPKNIFNPGSKKVLKLMAPRTLALGLGEIESTLPVFLASSLLPGNLSLFYLSQHLYVIPVRLFGITLGQAVFPHFSQLWAENQLPSFKRKLVIALHQVFYLTSFVTVIMLVLRVPLVRLLFGSKQFPWVATIITGRLLAFLSPAILAQAGVQILARAFYSLQDTKTTFFVALFSLLINIIISFSGVYLLNWGIYSLAIAISLASLFQFLSLFFILLIRVNHFNQEIKINLSFFSKLIIANFFAGFTAWLLMRSLDKWVFDTSRVTGLLLLSLISFFGALIVYIFSSRLLKIFLFDDIFKFLSGFFKTNSKVKIFKQSFDIS